MNHLIKAEKHFNLQKKWGNDMVEFWETLKEFEETRLSSLKEALKLYMEKYSETYDKQKDIGGNILNEINEFEDLIFAKKTFDLKNVCNPDHIRFLYKISQRDIPNEEEKLSWDSFKNYFTTFSMKKINNNYLVAKDFNALQKIKEKNKTRGFSFKEKSMSELKWENIKIILTIDKCILIFTHFEENSKKLPDKILRMGLCTCKRNDELFEVTINELIPNFFWSFVETYELKFNSQKDYEDFFDITKGIIKIS